MSLRTAESFAAIDTNFLPTAWIIGSGSPGANIFVDANSGRFGAGSSQLRLQDRVWLYKQFDAQTTWVFGAAIMITSQTFGDNLLEFSSSAIGVGDGAGDQFCVIITNTGTVQVARGNSVQAGGTVLAGSTQVLPLNAWFYFEVKVVIDAVAGSYAVRLNGAPMTGLPDVSGINTTFNGGASADRVIIHGGANVGHSMWSDLYILDGAAGDSSFYGDIRVQPAVPKAPGFHTDFGLVGAASNWQAVSEIPPDGDTSYTFSGTPGDIDSFPLSRLLGSVGSIKGIVHKPVARKDDAGARSIVVMQRQAATDYASTKVLTLSNTYQQFEVPLTINPATGVAFTPNDLGVDAEFGYKENA